MCECAKHSRGVIVHARVKKSDPTRTLSLRAAFERQMHTRFNKLKQDIRKAIIQDDCFGLKSPQVLASPGVGAFTFGTTGNKVDSFMKWLNNQVNSGILTVGYAPQYGSALQAPWTNMYIADSYQRGIQRGRYELAKAGYKVPGLDQTGGMAASMSTPFHMDRVGLLYTRTFNELKGITSTMEMLMSRTLAEGMANGDGPSLLARKMNAVIEGWGENLSMKDSMGRFIPAKRRATILARTEVIRAHHAATIQEYRNWGAVRVKVQAEWQTAQDERVCDECAALEGQVFILDEIEPMIPVHPMCRCLALPMEVKKVETAPKKRD